MINLVVLLLVLLVAVLLVTSSTAHRTSKAGFILEHFLSRYETSENRPLSMRPHLTISRPLFYCALAQEAGSSSTGLDFRFARSDIFN